MSAPTERIKGYTCQQTPAHITRKTNRQLFPTSFVVDNLPGKKETNKYLRNIYNTLEKKNNQKRHIIKSVSKILTMIIYSTPWIEFPASFAQFMCVNTVLSFADKS